MHGTNNSKSWWEIKLNSRLVLNSSFALGDSSARSDILSLPTFSSELLEVQILAPFLFWNCHTLRHTLVLWKSLSEFKF